MGHAEKEGGGWPLGGGELFPGLVAAVGDASRRRGVSPLLPFCHSNGHFGLGGIREEHPHEPRCVHVAGRQHLRRGSDKWPEERIRDVQVQHAARVLHRPLVPWQETREGG